MGVSEIELSIDSLDAYDYENSTNTKYFSKDIKMILINEIKLMAQNTKPKLLNTKLGAK